MPEEAVAIIIVFIVVGIPVICGTLISLAKIILKSDRGSTSSGKGSSSEEVRLIQEMHRGLSRLEERIESLETIVTEHDKTRKESSNA